MSFVIGVFYQKGITNSLKKNTPKNKGEITTNGYKWVQKQGRHQKYFLSKRGYEVCHRWFLPKGDYKFVKKKKDP